MEKPQFDFKKGALKAWNSFLNFMKPYLTLDTEVLTPELEPFLKKHIQVVYKVGAVFLLVLAILSLRHFPAVFVILGEWFALVVIFVLFRLLCEFLVRVKSSKK